MEIIQYERGSLLEKALILWSCAVLIVVNNRIKVHLHNNNNRLNEERRSAVDG